MAEKWLDTRAMRALERNMEPIMTDTDEIEIEMATHDDTEKEKAYRASRLIVELPGTSERVTIDYVSPNIQAKQVKGKVSSAPDFQEPKPKFDVFEHFQFEWIRVPGLKE